MGAGRALAMGIDLQRVIVDGKAALLGNRCLSILDLGIKKLFHMPAVEADQMIVMGSPVQFEHGFAAFEMVAHEQSGLFELGQHAVHCGQTDIDPIMLKTFVNILGTQMAGGAVFEQGQHFKAG